MEPIQPSTNSPPKLSRRYGQLVNEDSAPGSHRTCRCPYGYVVWTVLTVGQITTFFGTSAGLTFSIEGIKSDLQLSRSVISLTYAVGTLLGAAAQIPIGRAVDRFGGRLGVTMCSTAFYVSLAAMSLPTHWATLTLAFTAMRTLGFGGLALTCNTCLQNWFVRRRGLATGLSESVNSLIGYGLCAQLYAMAVVHYGWRRAFELVGAVLLLYPPVAFLLLRSRPEDIGLAPDGDPTEGLAGAASATPGGTGPAKAAAAVTGWRLREAMRTSALWILIVANALQWGIGAGFFFHLESIAEELQLDVGLLPSCFYLPWAASRALALVLAGWLLDWMPPRLIMCVCFLVGGLSMLLIGWPGVTLSPVRTVATAALWGFSMGMGKACFSVCPAQFFGRRHLGSIQGLLSTSNVASTAFGPLLIGVAHDLCENYSPIILTIAALNLFVGALGALFLRVPRRQRTSADDADLEHATEHEPAMQMPASHVAKATLSPETAEPGETTLPPECDSGGGGSGGEGGGGGDDGDDERRLQQTTAPMADEDGSSGGVGGCVHATSGRKKSAGKDAFTFASKVARKSPKFSALEEDDVL